MTFENPDVIYENPGTSSKQGKGFSRKNPLNLNVIFQLWQHSLLGELTEVTENILW